MKKVSAITVLAMAVSLFAASGFARETANGKSGEALFKEHCSMCHPDGGNIINYKKTLHKKDRDANNVKKAEDIVKKMRDPGPGMTKFDKKTVTDKDAKEIAEYILKTFK